MHPMAFKQFIYKGSLGLPLQLPTSQGRRRSALYIPLLEKEGASRHRKSAAKARECYPS
jgi:hypothetical protein